MEDDGAPMYQAEVIYLGGDGALADVLRFVRPIAESFDGASYNRDLTRRRVGDATSFLFSHFRDAVMFKRVVLGVEASRDARRASVQGIDLTKLGKKPLPEKLDKGEKEILYQLGMFVPSSASQYF